MKLRTVRIFLETTLKTSFFLSRFRDIYRVIIKKNSPKEIPIQLKERNIARYFIGLCAIYRNSNFKTNVSKVTIQKAFKTRNNVKIVEILGRTLSSMTSIRKTGSFKLLNFLTFKKQTKIKIFLIRSL
ncbi:hypothetical protein LEP1GSC179_2320 [Leptospira santarosai str. MOR084]|uniref:Uncharacterized protein n=1 Tax=Leptospira santarosai str. MOR084 TaxID=1049984 RepID=A0A0E2BIW6_9LEPT|nr:hypothetical protein LEP1GSC179_2320 [Leptospira santarosai str. MOR084]